MKNNVEIIFSNGTKIRIQNVENYGYKAVNQTQYVFWIGKNGRRAFIPCENIMFIGWEGTLDAEN